MSQGVRTISSNEYETCITAVDNIKKREDYHVTSRVSSEE